MTTVAEKFKLDSFQEEAIQHIKDKHSVIVCAPTGAGKTVIAQEAIRLAIANNKKVFYTAPLKALINQKYSQFCEQYGQEKVGIITGDTNKNRDAQIIVMIPTFSCPDNVLNEKQKNLLSRGLRLADDHNQSVDIPRDVSKRLSGIMGSLANINGEAPSQAHLLLMAACHRMLTPHNYTKPSDLFEARKFVAEMSRYRIPSMDDETFQSLAIQYDELDEIFSKLLKVKKLTVSRILKSSPTGLAQPV